MKSMTACIAALFAIVLVAGVAALRSQDVPKNDSITQDVVNESDETPVSFQDAAKKVPISKNITLEVDGDKRRVLINAEVCLRQGQLEQLLTRKRTKEHEAVLVADLDARDLHKALLLTGAEAGTPVKFQPKFAPPTGTPINVTLEYKEKDKTVRRPAQEWIRNIKTKKPLEANWVFAGSRLFKDPLDAKAPPYYLANDGDVICIANFETALMDVPFDSTKENDSLSFEANTDLIPALNTAVTLILEPIPAPKK